MCGMSLTADDFRDFIETEHGDDESELLGDALAAVAVDVEIDSVEAVRSVREQV